MEYNIGLLKEISISKLIILDKIFIWKEYAQSYTEIP